MVFSGRPRPDPPGPGQESVWDYPRPPRLEPVTRASRSCSAARRSPTRRAAYRVLETSHPPNYYFPPDDVLDGALERAPRARRSANGRVARTTSRCAAAVASRDRSERGATTSRARRSRRSPATSRSTPVAWTRASSTTNCVAPQPGGFYGGWITADRRRSVQGRPGLPRLVAPRSARAAVRARTVTVVDLAILLFDDVTALDAVGPYEVLQRIPGMTVRFVAPDPGIEEHRGRLARRWSPTPRSTTLPAPDIVLVPGGVGEVAMRDDERVLQWLRAAHETSRVHDVGVHRLARARGGRHPARACARPRTGPAMDAARRARRGPGGRTGRRERQDRHRGRRVVGHRHGTACSRRGSRATTSRRPSSCRSSTTPQPPFDAGSPTSAPTTSSSGSASDSRFAR